MAKKSARAMRPQRALTAREPGMSRKQFERQLAPLQLELVKMLDWIRASGHRLVVVLRPRRSGEGRHDQAHRQPTQPAVLPRRRASGATDRQRTQWYFQRYVAPICPRAGRWCSSTAPGTTGRASSGSWASAPTPSTGGFLRSVPEFERMLTHSGIQLIKYWFSVSDEEQERRFRARIEDRSRRWKLSPLGPHSRSRWVESQGLDDGGHLDPRTHRDMRSTPTSSGEPATASHTCSRPSL